MFQGKIISRSHIDGKVHTFQKDFDTYESYQEFMSQHPEFSFRGFFDEFQPLRSIFRPYYETPPLAPPQRYLPEGVSLEKYEQRKQERRLLNQEKTRKRQSLEQSKEYLIEYLKENPEDTDAKDDLEKIEKELSNIEN